MFTDHYVIKKIFNMITEETRGTLMYGRDWNIQLQPSLDSTNTTKRMNLKTCTVKKGYKVPKTLSEIYDINDLLIIRKVYIDGICYASQVVVELT